MNKRVLSAIALAVLAATSFAADLEPDQAGPDIADRFKAMYPRTHFTAVRKAKVDGLYEVVMGDNVAYTDETGRYFIFGHLFDMAEQVDLTAQRQRDAKKVEFPAQFLKNAIRIVKGDGTRVVALFADPDCPYCKTLETELARIDNVTVYVFLFPLESLHPEAKNKSIAVWCSKDQQAAWSQAVLTGQSPQLTACPNPINENLVLGSRLGVVGTPTLIALDGRVLPGAASAQLLEKWLAGPNTGGSAQ